MVKNFCKQSVTKIRIVLIVLTCCVIFGRHELYATADSSFISQESMESWIRENVPTEDQNNVDWMECIRLCKQDGHESDIFVVAPDVGQANFMILVKGEECVIVDAGSQKELSEPVSNKIKAILNGVMLKAVFITHPHCDHYNSLESFLDVKDVENLPVIIGGSQEDYTAVKEIRETIKNNIGTITCTGLIDYLKSIKTNSPVVKEYISSLQTKINILKQKTKRDVKQQIDINVKLREAMEQHLARDRSFECFIDKLLGNRCNVTWTQGLVDEQVDPMSVTVLTEKFLPNTVFTIYRKGVVNDRKTVNQSSYPLVVTSGVQKITFLGDAEDRNQEELHGQGSLNIQNPIQLLSLSAKQEEKELYQEYQDTVLPVIVEQTRGIWERIANFISVLDDQTIKDRLRTTLAIDDKEVTAENVQNKIEELLAQTATAKVRSPTAMTGINKAMQFLWINLPETDIFADVLGIRDALVEMQYELISRTMGGIVFPFEYHSLANPNDVSVSIAHAHIIEKDLKDSTFVVLPHHGSPTHGSPVWIKVVSTGNKNPIFLINSAASEEDNLPKRSVIDLIPETQPVQIHPIVYAEDQGSQTTLKVTSRPVYITGSAPLGAEIFALSPINQQILHLIPNLGNGAELIWELIRKPL